jgi:putative thioredoxin
MTLELTSNIIDLTPDNFQQVLAEESQHKLVIIDFWADWCEPCKNLMPILEKLANEYGNKVILAKVNCDEQQAIAAQFGVRNLPTVMLVKNAQPVDGFAGLQPEGEIRQKIEAHLPKPEDDFVTQAQQLLATGNATDAYNFAKQAFDLDSDRIDIRLTMADAAVSVGKSEDAKAIIDTIGLADQDGYYQSIVSKIELAEQAADTPEIQELQNKLAATPDDLETMCKLAVQYSQVGKSEQALETILKVVTADINFAEAKKLMLDMIAALPDGDPLASQYRRKLFTLMY